MAQLNETPSSERLSIGFFGVRNAGKSSLVNSLCDQKVAIVSDVAGTTTDPVRKSIELLPLGPVTIIDTPGIDDEGKLGSERVARTKQVLEYIDLAIVVTDRIDKARAAEKDLIALCNKQDIPYIIVHTKIDLLATGDKKLIDEKTREASDAEFFVSSVSGEGIDKLREGIAHHGAHRADKRQIVGDIVKAGDVVVLVCPIDPSAPKSRLILPQVMTIRSLIDAGAIPVVCQPEQLTTTLDKLSETPQLVISDSQALMQVASTLNQDIPLTTFSILMARYKGDLADQMKGAETFDRLCSGNRILIVEACTHNRQCDDIGTKKLPHWIKEYSHCCLKFDFACGQDFPEKLSEYDLVVHCGGCMLTPRAMKLRQQKAGKQHIPFTNYGLAIAKLNDLLSRVLAPLDVNPKHN